MALEPGTRLGPYEVTGPLGAGGMGEVYQARDTKLGRDVALKVLPEAFTEDPDRLARFEREAKVLASLNHPHIAHIYGLEEAEGQKALVLELVEGPTLADRIAQGRIPLDAALPIAKQIAEAVEAAHERGIIHRDLKPANVKVKPDGRVKVLDFGLAKAYSGEPEAGASSSDLSQSPTLAHSGTQAGVILGTAAYMSPEQARGKPVDKRADIWAFGVCLFEMLTGRRPFDGDTTTDVLAAIVGQEPRWELLERGTPPRVRDLVEQCLEKNARARLRDIGDARIAVDRALAVPEDASRPGTSTPAYRRWGLIVAAALLAALGGWLLRPLPSPSRPGSRPLVTRFEIELPAGASPPVISPDGRLVAFTDPEGLKVRALNSLEVRLVPGTGGAVQPPFFSPDGQWIGYLSSCCSIHRVRADGGASVPVVNTDVISGASWGHDDTIVFSVRARGGLFRVPVDSADATALTHLRRDEGELGHTWPQVLPDGRNVVFTVETEGQSKVGVASLETGQHRVLFAGSKPHYISTGHVVFAEGGALFAVPFSLDEVKPLGDPFPVLRDVATQGWGTGSVDYYSLSESGSLAYVPGTGQQLVRRNSLVEIDRAGQVLRVVASGNDYVYPRLSPSERVVVVSEQRQTRDLWFLDLERARPTRFTFAGSVFLSLWRPDGGALVYSSSQGLYQQKTDGSEAATVLSEGFQYPGAWSPDGDALAVTRIKQGTREDIWIVSRDEREAKPFAETAFKEVAPVFSPDGRSLAYVSDESGTDEVYVRPFPGPGGKMAVSRGGGTEPIWTAQSNEIIYRRGNEVHSVTVRQLTPTIELGEDRLLFEGAFDGTRVGPPDYDVSRDGKRFYMVQVDEKPRSASRSIHVVLNWFDEVLEHVSVAP